MICGYFAIFVLTCYMCQAWFNYIKRFIISLVLAVVLASGGQPYKVPSTCSLNSPISRSVLLNGVSIPSRSDACRSRYTTVFLRRWKNEQQVVMGSAMEELVEKGPSVGIPTRDHLMYALCHTETLCADIHWASWWCNYGGLRHGLWCSPSYRTRVNKISRSTEEGSRRDGPGRWTRPYPIRA